MPVIRKIAGMTTYKGPTNSKSQHNNILIFVQKNKSSLWLYKL